MNEIQNTLRAAVSAGDTCVRPLAVLQDIIDRATELLYRFGVEHRAEIEAQADATLEILVATIPRPMLRAAIMLLGPRLIDMALDSVFGPDGDDK